MFGFNWNMGKQRVRWMIGLGAVAALTGCGGSGEGDYTANQVTDMGEVYVALTDAEGSFASYTVDIVSIELKKANGAEVEVVPLTSRINFADYTDLTELFTVATVPAGIYTEASLVVDYSNADIVVLDEAGTSYSATVQNGDGESITELEMDVALANDKPLVVRRGIPAALTLDFDLLASNTIESFEPALVTVEPVLLVDAAINTDRDHRVRGMLKAVDVDGLQFQLDMVPLMHRERHSDRPFGEPWVAVTSETHFEVDGEPSTGEEGLLALSEHSQDEQYPVIALGRLNEDKQFQAIEVYGGSSVPWSDNDVIRGEVIARSGNTLTVRGRYINRDNGSVVFRDDIELIVSDATQMTQQALSNEGLTIQALSIGQRIIAFGDMTGEVSGSLSLDASDGHVRMMMNLIKGEVLSLEPLTLDLRWINGRPLDILDFTGTGVDSEHDADPDAYEIDTNSLTLDTLEVPDWIKVRGMVTPFGTAPADFTATTIINMNIEQRAALAKVMWPNAGEDNTPFVSVSADQLELDLTDARVAVFLAGVPLSFSNDEAPARVVPAAADGTGLYGVKSRRRVGSQIYGHFTDFVDGVSTRLAMGQTLTGVTMTGRYDSELGQIQVVEMFAHFLEDRTYTSQRSF